MAGKRSYQDVCGVARALDLVGERWALMLVRELLLGPKRFTDLRDGLPTLGPDVLTQRLRELSAAGLVAKRRLPPPAASQVYELTALGRELGPVILALGRFGAQLPLPGAGGRMSFDAHVLSFETLFDPALAGTLQARVELRLRDQVFRAEVTAGRFAIERGDWADPDVVITGDEDTVLAVAHGRLALAEAERAGAIAIRGDEAVGRRFLGLFPLPAAAAAGASGAQEGLVDLEQGAALAR